MIAMNNGKHVLSLMIVLAFAAEGLSHPGRLDSRGGHRDSSTGTYHYHHGGGGGGGRSGLQYAPPVIFGRPHRVTRKANKSYWARLNRERKLKEQLEAEEEVGLEADQKLRRKTIPEPTRERVLTKGDTLTAMVEQIESGETFSAGKRKVRLFGVDAPKVNEFYGSAAKAHLNALVRVGSSVKVKHLGTSSNGEILGIVISGNTVVNTEMIANGHARYFPGNGRSEILARYERDAREENLGLWARSPKPSARAVPATISGIVTKVHDADTIKLTSKGETTTVRLAAIDAPELNQVHGMESRDAAAAMVLNQLCRCRVIDIDRYGRVVGIVKVEGSKTTLNEQLVREGHAWHYKDFSKSKTLAEAEEAARRENLGLWAREEEAVPPWEWRKQFARRK